MNEISPIIKEKAPLILAEIQKAKSILLHCHPSPDPDSIGSALAMKFALEQMGKKATVIKGDSEIPRAFMHFPGANEIVNKNFFEIDLEDFDLMIALDSASPEMISRRGKVEFPESLKVIVIDHHMTNGGFGFIDLIEPSYPANCQVLFDLFHEWAVNITPDIASNLFIGIYSDTGGLKYPSVTAHTYNIASRLVANILDISKLILQAEYSNTPGFMAFESIALGSIELLCGGMFALSVVSNSTLKEKKISATDVKTSEISSFLLSVPEWEITASIVEIEPNKIKCSLRSSDHDKFDVSKLAILLGGGGHRVATGVILNMPLKEAKELVVEKIKSLYNI